NDGYSERMGLIQIPLLYLYILVKRWAADRAVHQLAPFSATLAHIPARPEEMHGNLPASRTGKAKTNDFGCTGRDGDFHRSPCSPFAAVSTRLVDDEFVLFCLFGRKHSDPSFIDLHGIQANRLERQSDPPGSWTHRRKFTYRKPHVDVMNMSEVVQLNSGKCDHRSIMMWLVSSLQDFRDLCNARVPFDPGSGLMIRLIPRL